MCTPEDDKLNWMYKTFNCATKAPLRVTVVDTPSLVAGSCMKVEIDDRLILPTDNSVDTVFIVCIGCRTGLSVSEPCEECGCCVLYPARFPRRRSDFV